MLMVMGVKRYLLTNSQRINKNIYIKGLDILTKSRYNGK